MQWIVGVTSYTDEEILRLIKEENEPNKARLKALELLKVELTSDFKNLYSKSDKYIAENFQYIFRIDSNKITKLAAIGTHCL